MGEENVSEMMGRFNELIEVINCKVPKSASVIYEHMGEDSHYARISCVDRQDGSFYFSGVVDNVSLESGRDGIDKRAFKEIELDKFRNRFRKGGQHF